MPNQTEIFPNGPLNLPPPKTEAEMQAIWAAERAAEIKYACDNAGEFLRYAIANVNEQLGPATQYPAVVAALVEASAINMFEMPEPVAVDTIAIGDAIERAGMEIREALSVAYGLSVAMMEPHAS